MLEAQSAQWRGFDAGLGYQFAVATVTAFNSSNPAQSNLTGNWIPEVPRQSVTATVSYTQPKVASFHLIAAYQGQEFDDAANQYRLSPYARFDVSAERRLRWGLTVFAGAQNLLDREIDAGLTPDPDAGVAAVGAGGDAVQVRTIEGGLEHGPRVKVARN